MVTRKKDTATQARKARAPVSAARSARTPLPGRNRNSKRARGDAVGPVSATERARMIAQAAYHRAERRGFAPGHELEDWLAAEREVNHLLGPLTPSGSGTQG